MKKLPILVSLLLGCSLSPRAGDSGLDDGPSSGSTEAIPPCAHAVFESAAWLLLRTTTDPTQDLVWKSINQAKAFISKRDDEYYVSDKYNYLAAK